MSKFNPLDDRILVRKTPVPTKTIGGIIIPDTSDNKPQEGTAIEVGPGKRGPDGNRLNMSVKTGDTIIFGKNAGTMIMFDDEELFVMLESEIIAIIT